MKYNKQWTVRKKRAQVTSTILFLAPTFDSSISLMVPVIKIAIEWDKLFNAFSFLFQKLVKYIKK